MGPRHQFAARKCAWRHLLRWYEAEIEYGRHHVRMSGLAFGGAGRLGGVFLGGGNTGHRLIMIIIMSVELAVGDWGLCMCQGVSAAGR